MVGFQTDHCELRKRNSHETGGTMWILRNMQACIDG